MTDDLNGQRLGQLSLRVDAVAAVLVAGLALSRPWDALSLLLFLVALEVAAFAASQAVALRRPA